MIIHNRNIEKLLSLKRWFTLAAMAIFLNTGFTQHNVEVGGTLSGNHFWTKDTTYIVTENIRVPVGSKLHVGAGTIVRFNQGRGLNIEGGSLHIAGRMNDTVRFLPNYTGFETWNWAGISISSIYQPDMVLIEFALIESALVGIRGSSGNSLVIQNNRLHKNRNVGISLINSSSCLVQYNNISDNFLGLEVYAISPGNTSAFNLIRSNRFANQTTNVLLHNDNHGSCPYNIFEDNLLKGGINGFWLSNSSHGGTGHATVRRNIIINTGTNTDGFGMYISMDSTIINNNIFWRNTTAIEFTQSLKSHILNNSLYENKRGIIIRDNSSDLTILDNTITGTHTEAVVFNANGTNDFRRNNIFGNKSDSAIVKNLTATDISIALNYWGT